ncbi:VanZ family protein [Paenibacillus roseipurpureus]|uniref:VanZ family protein n=1 Tax=Paenibacillus roseopurpureus TaxID=2918901 RepID=A0AA96LR26_9BACL|nr:VanZ family protein [Paenibacillus sp. MBLB1832]WNR43255.1 VanZ family protein [Paenibacillus sp. MBLB1832]
MPKLTRSMMVFYVFLVAAVLWMAFIYMKSAETYQQQSLKPYLESKFSSAKLKEHFPHIEFTYDRQVISWRDPINFIEFIIRKAGHVSEYAVLALLWSIALLAKPVRLYIALFSSFLISIVYAMSDEWHQSFVKDRTGHGIDVCVDGIGILGALLVVWLVLVIRERIRARRTS